MKAGADCVFPGPGRAPRKSKRPQDAELLARLRRLEGAIEHLSANRQSTAQSSPKNSHVLLVDAGHSNATSDVDSNPPAATLVRGTDCNGGGIPRELHPTNCPGLDPRHIGQLQNEFGRLVIEEGRSRYVSNRLWTSLGDEIEELQDILDPSSSDEDDYSSQEASSSLVTNTHGFLFGFYSLSHSLREFHPPPLTILLMWDIYEENISPLVPILHKPTTRKQIREIADNLDVLNRHSEPLIFAIYLAVVISLSDEQCVSRLGECRETLVERYRFAVEQAFSKANFLNTQSLLVLQASVLFLICVRREDDTKFAWTMCAVVLRIAQGLGIHRDGTNFGLKPFETEMRRRLWWHIHSLDYRTSDEQGADALVHELMYDTRLPLNVNDEDLSPDMQDPPTERVGCTDMTFCLVRTEISVSLRRASQSCRFRRDYRPTLQEREYLIQVVNQRVEERYTKYCDTSDPYQWTCATIARLTLAKLWVEVQLPLTRQDPAANLSQETRDRLLRTSIEVIEFAYSLENNPRTSQWGWIFQSHKQWHAVAIILAELCVRPISPMTDRGWFAINRLFGEWDNQAKLKKGMMWRPVFRLLERATASRAKKQQELRSPRSADPSSSQIGLTPLPTGLSETILRDYIFPTLLPSQAARPTDSAPRQQQTKRPQSEQSGPLRQISGQLDAEMSLAAVDFPPEAFPNANWPAELTSNSLPPLPAPQQFANGSNEAPPMAETGDSATDQDQHMETRDDDPYYQLNWAEWDSVMRDFRQDLQNTEIDQAMYNTNYTSGWFV